MTACSARHRKYGLPCALLPPASSHQAGAAQPLRALTLALPPGRPVGAPAMDGPAHGQRKHPYDVIPVKADGSSGDLQILPIRGMRDETKPVKQKRGPAAPPAVAAYPLFSTFCRSSS